MFRKNYFTFFLAVALFLISSFAVSAQMTPINGKVELKKADGTMVPVEGATVDILRTDVKSTFLSTKTNKDGEFSFAGFPPEAVFSLSVSAPKTNPEYYPNLTGGLVGGFGIVVSEGDGRRLTEEEIRQAVALAANKDNQNAKLNEKQRKQFEEEQKKIAEINAKNSKSKETDALVRKFFDEGEKAFSAKNYDAAIVQYDEGYKASPDFIGSAPVLLNKKGDALRFRGVALYNQSREITDTTAKIESMKKVTKDFADAVDAFNLSYTMSKNTPPADVKDAKSFETNKIQALRGLKEVVKVMVTTEKIDDSKVAIIKTLTQEYITIETDKAAKVDAQVALADIYRLAGDFDNAIVEYKKALEIDPGNFDALANLGLSLYAAGEISGNTEQKQEGLNYMQKFADTAPSNHKLKESIAAVIQDLKAQKLTPQKTTKKKN